MRPEGCRGKLRHALQVWWGKVRDEGGGGSWRLKESVGGKGRGWGLKERVEGKGVT